MNSANILYCFLEILQVSYKGKKNEIPIPQCITNKLLELNRLAEQYPEDIPVKNAAEFLNVDIRSLKSYLIQSGNSIGLGWRKDMAANRGFHIPTTKFYLWYRNIVAKEV
jgi:hypothetical protein